MDMFYAAVELLDQPQLALVPMAVGEGIVLTANYVARKFGVRSAMPGHIARKLCPQLTVVPARYEKYHEISDQIREVFRVFDPTPMFAGLDEAYLDATAYCSEHGVTGVQAAEEIRRAALLNTQLTCSAGAAPNRLLAKLCGEINKPNGCFALAADRTTIRNFMLDLPLRKVPGVGQATEKMLAALGCSSCGDVLQHRAIVCAV